MSSKEQYKEALKHKTKIIADQGMKITLQEIELKRLHRENSLLKETLEEKLPKRKWYQFWKNIFILLFFILIFTFCKKPQRCWDCDIQTTIYYNPEHFTDTIKRLDTIETWCDINPREFERINTDTIYIFYIDSAGTIVGFYGTEVIITKCN